MDDRIFKNLPLIKFDFLKILKIHEIFYKILDIFFFNVYKEKMFTIEIEEPSNII